MKTVRICIISADHSSKGTEELYRLFYLDRNDISFVAEDKHPEYVIVTAEIYRDINCYRMFKILKRNNPGSVFIFWAGEAVMPDLNLFDYAVCYNSDIQISDRVICQPPDWFLGINEVNDLSYSDALKEYDKRKFCNFIYSNPCAHPRRDQLFYLVSMYKRIDSYGRHLHNMNTKVTCFQQDWKKLSVDYKKEYRFTIAAENAKSKGYISEKLITSMQAHSCPIYWGSESVEEEYNAEAFINANQYTDHELLDRIKEIDNNPEEWAKLVSAPWRTEEQTIKCIQKKKYEEFTKHIFMQSLKDAKRTDVGTWIDRYEDFFFSGRPKKYGMNEKSIKRIHSRISFFYSNIVYDLFAKSRGN